MDETLDDAKMWLKNNRFAREYKDLIQTELNRLYNLVEELQTEVKEKQESIDRYIGIIAYETTKRVLKEHGHWHGE